MIYKIVIVGKFTGFIRSCFRRFSLRSTTTGLMDSKVADLEKLKDLFLDIARVSKFLKKLFL